jgi:predicted aspartyl protease
MWQKLRTLAASYLLILAATLPSLATEIPLGTTGGIFTAPVQVNRSVTLDFLVDSGAAMVVIPANVFNNLVRNGTITQADIGGIGIAELADRSLYEAVQIRLRDLRVGNAVARDVTAAVAPGLSQPLLGQTFFNRFSYVTFDNQRHVLILPDTPPQYSTMLPMISTYPPYR